MTTNDNWQQGDTSQIPNGFAPSDPRESVIVATLAPGNYSAVLKGAHGETGVGLAEVYDLDSTSAAQLANISTRGFVNTGDNVMIGGFIVGGSEPTKVLKSARLVRSRGLRRQALCRRQRSSARCERCRD